MKQIKTISHQNAELFDDGVNTSLMDGWQLSRRYRANNGSFVAELEREIITERERCCENCAHNQKTPSEEPCLHCSEDCDKWEEAEA